MSTLQEHLALEHHNTLDTTQMTSLVAHVDNMNGTDSTTFLTPWTHGDVLTQLMNRWQVTDDFNFTLKSQKTLNWLICPMNSFPTTLEWHRFLQYIIAVCNYDALQSDSSLPMLQGEKDTLYLRRHNTAHPIGKHYANTGDICMKQNVLNSGKIIKQRRKYWYQY